MWEVFGLCTWRREIRDMAGSSCGRAEVTIRGGNSRFRERCPIPSKYGSNEKYNGADKRLRCILCGWDQYRWKLTSTTNCTATGWPWYIAGRNLYCLTASTAF